MKKKLMISMLSTLIFSMVITTLLFVIIENHEYIENMKRILKLNNEIIIDVINYQFSGNIDTFSIKHFKNTLTRETLIDKSGKVIGDSVAPEKSMANHNSRKEVQEARKNGTGYDIRWSDTTNKKTLYFATVFGNGYVMRSAVTMQTVKGFEGNYLKWYILVAFFSILVSLLFAEKFSKSIVKPIERLQHITFNIADGNFDSRVKISSSDEIGQLARNFNNMADRLQTTFEDSIDKRNKLEAILKSMDNGVIAVDMNYRIIMINPYAERIFGIHKNIIGEELLDGIRDFELEDIFKGEEDNYREIKILWPKERILRVKRASIINGKKNIGKVVVVQDITDIKKLENMRSQFVANVSHELKTPLTSIKGFAETLKYVEDEEDKNKFLNIINDEADRLTRLINDILTLSHIENSKMNKSKIVGVNHMIENICCMMQASAEKKHIAIRNNLCEEPNIWGDGDRFKQMVINLVDNAIKYTDNGGQVKVSTDIKDGSYLISVEDNGVGISKKHQEKLFERFYRVDKARSRSAGGTGLGLAIVKHIVLGFNGTIELESEVGKGSKFTIRIPLESSEDSNM
ncbi:MAG: cell wall metabolism sensor histidine kinase WalK [Clostridium luticellarii]|uniref:histidine kinase n=1 Tax=Clostridium luticellarii TaxID=1691940 RepID=A0A2T0BRF8_9CLOT|nr:HAMP domain-containing sensor histidine kinase [Clostridium luticellarii]MCI1994465.1 cell wall metabolism sensor histidine kinase WalK [Clostridium luticellarii]MCI2038582.1 cell wall metabolism sensor histidine kinase WalK [Clostridium luticellarii]PRR86456.1 Alkaline phosphatase synthesis sensor protein PhoR [Clostridium luticellarii]